VRAARLAGPLLLLLFCLRVADAQVLVHDAAGPTPVDGPWLVQTGETAADKPVRQWLHERTASGPQPRVLWMRTTLQLDQPLPTAALLVFPAAQECEVWVDGIRAARCWGLLGASGKAQRGLLIPLRTLAPGHPVSIAIRMLFPDTRTPGAPIGLGPGDVLVGQTAVLEDVRTAHDAAHFYADLPETLLCLGELLGGLVLLTLYFQDRRRREYLWFVLFLWLDGPCSLESVFEGVYPIFPASWAYFFDFFGMIARYAPLVGFLAAFTGLRVNRWVRAYQWVLVVLPFILTAHMWGAAHGWWPAFQLTLHQILLPVQLPFVAGSLIFLFWHWRRGNKEAGLLIPSFLLANGIEIVGVTGLAFHQVRLSRFQFDWDDLSMFFFLVSIGPVMLFRHRRINEEHDRAMGELDAARDIQQRLVPSSLPQLAGCRVEAAYLPADEVGGDFYQVLPQSHGATLIVVGDVSGKGLKAAMTGVLAIGALRALAAENLPPAELLRRLNCQLLEAQDRGFVTCLCARIDATGELTLANAGHLAPYCNGDEVPLQSGLPLGIAIDAEYSETTLQLAPGDRLTFLSDGVVEARNPAGELFGFDRTRSISTQSAEAIAAASQQFGQEDDITVLTLAFVPAEVLHA
jgi:phosphoserine phosphatase RsbU/P